MEHQICSSCRGLTSTIYAKSKDNVNLGASGWHIPVRYSNVRAGGDLGILTDLYYAIFIRKEANLKRGY